MNNRSKRLKQALRDVHAAQETLETPLVQFEETDRTDEVVIKVVEQ